MAKILLADDSAHAQRMGTKILSAEGHEVATVSNGQAAIKMLPEFAPDLIVADVFMPGKTGYEVCQFIKSDSKYAWIPVLLLVGKMEPYDPVEGHRVRADGVVTKPLESSDLLATVQNLLAAIKKPAPPPPEAEAELEAPIEDEIPIPVTAPLEMDIPQEIRNQPISLWGELLEPPAAPAEPAAVKRMAAEVSPIETAPWGSAFVEQPDTIHAEPPSRAPVAESTGIGGALAAALGTAGGEESAAAAPSSWKAEPAAVTEDDKKLFDPPPPDWQGLVSMVHEADEPPQQPESWEAEMERMGSRPEVESAAELSAASVASLESASPTAQTPPEPAGSSIISEPAEGVVSTPSLQGKSDSRTDSAELPAPTIAPLDYATVEQIVRETVEERMPEIIDRITKATGISFKKKG
ncbi:MAG: response regulator [Terriglobia bacterium]